MTIPAATLTKLKNFKDAAQAAGFEVITSSSPVNNSFGLLAKRGTEGETFIIGLNEKGAFNYAGSGYVAPGADKLRKIRNISEAARILSALPSTVPAKLVLEGTQRSISMFAKKLDTTADNAIGYATKTLLTNIEVRPDYYRCDICQIPNSASQMIASIAPRMSTATKEITYKGYNNVSFKRVCDGCADKHTDAR